MLDTSDDGADINIQKDLFQVTMSHKLPGLHSFVSLADTLLAGLLTGERLDKQTYKKLHDKDNKPYDEVLGAAQLVKACKEV